MGMLDTGQVGFDGSQSTVIVMGEEETFAIAEQDEAEEKKLGKGGGEGANFRGGRVENKRKGSARKDLMSPEGGEKVFV